MDQVLVFSTTPHCTVSLASHVRPTIENTVTMNTDALSFGGGEFKTIWMPASGAIGKRREVWRENEGVAEEWMKERRRVSQCHMQDHLQLTFSSH